MSYTIEHFESLCQRFPSWAELRSYLESDAGGRLRVVEAGEGQVVLRYVKGQSNLQSADLGVGLFRSVVWNTVTNRPVCVAPPKARAGLPPLDTSLSATEDFVDGFMINAWVDTTGSLQVATRTSVGGENTFYDREVSFGRMFDEALAASPLKDRAGLATVLQGVDTTAFASFVVQHPAHRIVAKVTSPSLYVVHVGTVTESGAVKVSERAVNWPKALGRFQVPSYPLRKFHTEKEVENLLRQTAVQRGWRWQGLVFKDGSGGRWRLRTPTYNLLRELRGAEAAPRDRFLRLRSLHKVTDYLKHYSEERDAFWEFEKVLRERTTGVLAAYTDVHKAHAVAFKDLPEAYRPAVFLLHRMWHDELRQKKFVVRLQEAIKVVSGLRDFEQKRLMDAEPYVAVAPKVEEAEDAGETEEAEAETTAA